MYPDSQSRNNLSLSVTQERKFNYGADQRLASTVFPENGTTSYTYTCGGKVATKVDAKGQRLEYVYDAACRVKEIRWYVANAATEQAESRTTFYYDENPADATLSVNTAGPGGGGVLDAGDGVHATATARAKRTTMRAGCC